MMKRLMTLVMGLILLPVIAVAATIHVPADQPTIQAGINAAVDGDTVLVAPGTYTGLGNREIAFQGKAVSLIGELGPDSTFIDVENLPYSGFSLVSTSEDTSSMIRGFTIKRAQNGANLERYSPRFEDVIFTQNGNGIQAAYGSIPLCNDCDFYSNSAGMIFDGESGATITRCSFSGNNTGLSVSNDCCGTQIICRSCTFHDNGYGVYDEVPPPQQRVSIDSCTFIDNATAVLGGSTITNSTFVGGEIAIEKSYHVGSGLLVSFCTFTGITGTVVRPATYTTLSHCVFRKNDGTILFSYGDENSDKFVTMTDCLVDSNQGGIYVSGFSQFSFSNSTYSSNSGGITLQCAPEYGSYWKSISNCNFIDNSTIPININALTSGASIIGCRFVENHAADVAISIYGNTSSNVEGCSFLRNQGTSAVSLWTGASTGKIFVKNCSVIGGTGHGVQIAGSDGAITIEKTLISDNHSAGVMVEQSGVPNLFLLCNDFYGNLAGNYIGVPDQTGINGNISLDPQHCGSSVGNYGLFSNSPCAPANNSCGVLIGADSVECSIPAVQTLCVGSCMGATHVVGRTPQILWDYLDQFDYSQTSFEIMVGTDSNWAYAEMWNPAPFNTSDTFVVYNGAALVDGATYWLRLRVNNALAWSEWKQLMFRMNSIPTVPQLRLPLAGAIVSSQQPGLIIRNSTDAESDSLLYTFEVSPDNFVATVFTFTEKQDADSLTTLIVDSTLVENGQYWWRVKASDYYESSAYSPVRSFWVDAENTIPTAFALSSPDSGLTTPLTTLLPQFTWVSSSDPDPLDLIRYTLFIAVDQRFNFAKQIPNLTMTSYTLTDSLTWGTRYWWKVKANDLNGGSTWSKQVYTFRTMTLGDADGDGSVTIADVVFLINYIFRGGGPPQPLMTGDPNCDGDINIADAVYLISYIFSHGPAPCSAS